MSDFVALDWLMAPNLQRVLSVLNEGEAEARIAGGAVRNALLNEPISDIDIATTLVPRDVTLRARENGLKTVPTGIEHGTVTVICEGDTFEVTTLRQDIETDGRHAKVLYGTDWEADARRRDLTINALYMNADGTVFDPLNGLPDVSSQTVRFIDDAETRIKEDYLRILRFFRFFAWYGKFRPDAEGLKASARLKEGLADLSVERIWQELIKLLSAPDPSRAILWMRQTGVLSAVLPESEKWGIDALPALIETEASEGWETDGLLRLMAILPPQPEKMQALSTRLKLPNKVRDRLKLWAGTPEPDALLKQDDFYKSAYRQDRQALNDRLYLAIARRDDRSKKFARQMKWLNRWESPEFPLRGQDILEKGVQPGPRVAEILNRIEAQWIEGGFKATRENLLDQIET